MFAGRTIEDRRPVPSRITINSSDVSIHSLHKHVFYTNVFARLNSYVTVCTVQQMGDSNGLYKELGRKIRAAREQAHPRLSQDKLAKRLGVSRASVVNIEAGRQHAPLQLLWQIAENLETELALLIPRRSELLVPVVPVELDAKTIEQIKHVAEGDKQTQKTLTGMVSKLKTTLEITAPIKRKGTP